MTPAVGRADGQPADDRQAVGPARPPGQAPRARPRPRGRGARRGLPPGDRAGRRQEGGHRRRPPRPRRAARRPRCPASVELVGWSVTSSPRRQRHGLACRSRVQRRGSDGRGHRQRPGRRAVLARSTTRSSRSLGWHPVLTEYEIKAVSAGEDAQGQVLVRCRRSSDEGPGALIASGHGLSHQHHRGVARGLPRGRQQAPRGGDQRRRRGVRRAPDRRGPASDGWLRGAQPPTSDSECQPASGS